jgi:hypothetical protein
MNVFSVARSLAVLLACAAPVDARDNPPPADPAAEVTRAEAQVAHALRLVRTADDLEVLRGTVERLRPALERPGAPEWVRRPAARLCDDVAAVAALAPDARADVVGCPARVERAIGLYHAGRAADALAELDAVLALYRKHLGPQSYLNASTTLLSVDLLLDAESEWPRAGERFERARRDCAAAYGPDHPTHATLHEYEALLAERRGEGRRAEELFRAALALRCKTQGERHADTIRGQLGLVRADVAAGRTADAGRGIARLAREYNAILLANPANLKGEFLATAARHQSAAGNEASARLLQEEAVSLLMARVPKTNPRLLREVRALRAILSRLDERELVKKLDAFWGLAGGD